MRRYPKRAPEDDEGNKPSFEGRADHIERILLASVLREAVREYLPQKQTSRNRSSRKRAREWIFESKERSDMRFLGFDFICKYLGIDPDQARARIRELEKGDNRRAIYSDLVHVYPAGRKGQAKSERPKEV